MNCVRASNSEVTMPRQNSNNSRRAVRLASSRKRPPQGPKRALSPRRKLPRITRGRLFRFYLLVFCVPLGLIIIGHLAVFAHDTAVPGLLGSASEQFADGFQALVSRPTLAVAFLAVMSFLWCFPWEFFSLLADDDNTVDQRFRRGRQLRSYADAAELNRMRRKTRAQIYQRRNRR